ncbi:glycosyltransferase family 4 protein [Acidimangrovimonas sediminis]|uniref:glycosyltransferase family 4 protein n=1 Tax=Acidimangrovimonas sediminis TaxID=2056283 RepID=UPI000C7F9642|nr:glycosyltransferase family 4 protein [Acidimangrovimonas sediminis]
MTFQIRTPAARLPRIAHLVDDTTPGGVSRYLAFIAADTGMAALGTHRIVPVPRSRPASVSVEADIIVSHLTITWRGLPGLMALRARHAGTPLIHVEHSYCEGFVAANVRARRRFLTLLRAGYALFDRVAAVSAEQAGWMDRHGLVAPGVLSVVPPSVDFAPFRAVDAAADPARTFALIGRLDRQKGFDVAIAAFRAVEGPDLRLKIFGEGPEGAALRALAAGDARITFEGHAPAPNAAYAAADVVLMPSRWEPFGLVAREALVAGRRLVVSATDGLRGPLGPGATRVAGLSVGQWSEAIAGLAQSHSVATSDTDTDTGGGAGAEPEVATRDGWAVLLAGLWQSAPVPSDMLPVDVLPA